MEDAVVGDAATATRGGARPSSASLALRPLGYVLIGLVWLALWAAVVVLAWGIPVWGLIDGTLTVAEFTEPATSSVGGFLALVLVVAPIMVIIGGPVLLWWLPNCTWPLASLSFLYVMRSLNPAYRGEKLSFTAQGARGSTLGPPTVSTVALSLQPVRTSALARFLMRFYAAGWQLDGRSFFVMLPAGVGWLLVFPAIAMDVTRTTNVVCGVIAALLIVFSLAWALRLTFVRPRPKDRPAPSENRS
jgi:hypothetical protein